MLRNIRVPTKVGLLLFLLYLIPILSVVGLIVNFGVNIPAYDQWVLPQLLEKTGSGTLKFSDLFELHNTHRILFPRIIFIGLAWISNWNIKLEMFFSLGLAILTALSLYRLSQITTDSQNRPLFHLANLLTFLLIFSLNQEWLWGFQLPIFLINFCLILACLILYEDIFIPKIRLILAAILCFIASFSSAQGLLTWLGVIPLILSLQGESQLKTKRVIIWLSLFILSAGLYAIGYQKEPTVIKLEPLEYFLNSIHFFLNLIAASIIKNPSICWMVGLITLCLFLGITLQKSRQFIIVHTFSNAAPWISIGLFSVLTSILITWGRVELGVNYPLFAVRYTTHTLLLIIALVHLGRIVISENLFGFQLNPVNQILVYGFFAGVLSSLVWVSSEASMTQAKSDLFFQKSSQTCLHLIHYLEDSQFMKNDPNRCLLRMSKSTWWIRDGVESLEKINLRTFAQNVTFISQPNQVYGYIDHPPTTEGLIPLKRDNFVNFGGWAILPDQPQQPGLIFLSNNQQKSFFANADVNQPSPDIAAFLNSSQYHQARWQVSVSGESLPLGESTIFAWVYDPHRQQFIQLKGQVKIQVQE